MDVFRCLSVDLHDALEAIRGVKGEQTGSVAATTKADMAWFLKDEVNHLYVAKEGDDVIGYLLAYELQRPYGSAKMMLLYEVLVRSAYRRKGVGTLLVEAAKRHCVRDGFVEMFLIVSRGNEAAVSLFEKAGAEKSLAPDEVRMAWRF